MMEISDLVAYAYEQGKYVLERGIVSTGICQISIHKDHVRLAFVHGAFLPEPRGLFEGTQKYKRFIRIASYDDVPWDYFREPILSASKFDPRLVSSE